MKGPNIINNRSSAGGNGRDEGWREISGVPSLFFRVGADGEFVIRGRLNRAPADEIRESLNRLAESLIFERDVLCMRAEWASADDSPESAWDEVDLFEESLESRLETVPPLRASGAERGRVLRPQLKYESRTAGRPLTSEEESEQRAAG